MIFILIGAPGAGKGTHSDALVRDFACVKLSTGDILRRHIKEKTEIGRRCEDIISRGQLVDDATLWQLLEPELRHYQDKCIILDGYPRNRKQAEQLQIVAAHNPIRAVVHIKASEESLIERLCGRMVCPNCQAIYHVKNLRPKVEGVCDRCGTALQVRPDDQRDKVMKRLEVFAEETMPIVRYYQDLGLYTAVDGDQGIDAVYREITEIFQAKMK